MNDGNPYFCDIQDKFNFTSIKIINIWKKKRWRFSTVRPVLKATSKERSS